MTQLNAPVTLASLPDEILGAIFYHLDAPTLVNLGTTSKRFTALSNEPSLWRRFCQNDYTYWNNKKALRQLLRDGSYRDWKTVYQDRHTVSRTTQNTLNDIITDSKGRSDRIQAIVDQGYKSKDTLMRAFRESSSSPNHLAQRYWSHVTMGTLHRSIALQEWVDIKSGSASENLIERSMAAFDMFVLDQQEQGDVEDIFERLDSYADAIRSAYPDIDSQSPKTKAMVIAAYLRERRWIGIDQNRDYHSLDNMFLGVALFSSHNNSLPLISSVIYSYVARQFGLRAQPVSYPMHVHVLVQPLPGFDLDGNSLPLNHNEKEPSVQTHLYMDPFNGIEPVSLNVLQHQLRFIAPTASAAQVNMYLSGATHRDLLIRSAHNILNTRTVGTRPLSHPINSESALYAAFFALVFFPTHPAALRTHLTELTKHFIHHYEYDLHIFQRFILPLTSSVPDHLAYRNLSLQLLHNDMEVASPKLRSLNPSATPVKFQIGQIFRHRRRNYRAVIYGWDSTCEMSPQWISMNEVDRLPRGRNQPFYNVFVIDDKSMRYVAEENVMLLGPPEEGGSGEYVSEREVVEEWPIEIGKWMKRLDVDETGLGWRFVSNVKEQYPED